MDWIEAYTVVDLEMTGLNAKNDKIIEIGAVKVADGKVVDTYGTLVRTDRHLEERVTKLTGITPELLSTGADESEAVEKLLTFINGDVIVGHNINMDYAFIKQWAINNRVPLELKAYDTLRLARRILPGEQSKRLDDLCEFYEIKRDNAHRALDDALATYEIFEKLKALFNEKGEQAAPLLLQYKAKRQTPATKHQIENLKAFQRQYNIVDDLSWDSLTRSQASRLYDEYRAKYGPLVK